MALNSQAKRMSASGVGRPYLRGVFPVASPTVAWRSGVGLTYNGNPFAGPSAVVAVRRRRGAAIRHARSLLAFLLLLVT